MVYKLPNDRTYATYFGGDEKLDLAADNEVRDIWLNFLPPARVLLPFGCKSQMKNNELEMASMEQKKADENILRFIESQKREKEAALNKILQLEKKLDAKQKLELEIEELKGNRQVMQHMGGEDDQKLQEQMKKIDEDLKDKMDEMEDLEAMNQTLLVKERKCNDELQEARKVLIEGLREMLSTRTGIIIKRMGELDPKPFQKACMARFPGKEAMEKAAELCSLWACGKSI